MATKPRTPIDLGLKEQMNELFMNDQQRAENRLPRIHDIPLNMIDEFPDHPFQVRMDEDMDQLVESVKERGVITPVTLRKKEDGRYETVSGHRRIKACDELYKYAKDTYEYYESDEYLSQLFIDNEYLFNEEGEIYYE